MTVITRFAPSPTGYLHIGGARTAIYNWLYARKYQGKFLLRVEDTDMARHDNNAVQAIFDGLEWLGLDWDDEVVFQSGRRGRHAEVAQALIDAGQAYYCYASQDELEHMREQARREGRTAVYDRRWRDADPAEAPPDIAPCVRIKAPLEGEIVIQDRVQGEIRIQAGNLDDFVILRSDGTPTYMLSVVVDDHDMGVSHVIRGDDHLNNASRQAVIYKAMGWSLPEFAHIPLILASDGSKLSKRHGAVSVTAYRDMGYLPEAMCNYLLRLGWGYGDREIIPRDEAIQLFDIDDVSKGAARFDFEKLDSINAHYLRESDHARLANLVCAIFEQRGLRHDETVQNRLIQHMQELTSRSKTLMQVADDSEFYAKEPPYDLDDGALQKLSNDEALTVLRRLRKEMEQLEPFESDAIQGLCKQVAGELAGGKMGRVGMPLRAALTGKASSPSIFTAAAVLGREACLQRIDHALQKYDNDIQQKAQ